MIVRLRGIRVWLAVLSMPSKSAELQRRSILVLDLSAPPGACHNEICSAFHTDANADTRSLTTRAVVQGLKRVFLRQLAKILDGFFTTPRKGMGLGLSIARTVVQAHKRAIWAEYLPDGAVLRVAIPLAAH